MVSRVELLPVTLLLLLLLLLMGWAAARSEQDQEPSWAVYKWAAAAATWSDARTPERHEDPTTYYAAWTQGPQLPLFFVEEDLKEEEAAWMQGQEALQTIRKRYAIGSKQFEESFAGQTPEPHAKTTATPASSPHTTTTTPATSPSTTTTTTTTTTTSPQYPGHPPQYHPGPSWHHRRPRKYYLSGVMEEIEPPRVRQYNLLADASGEPEEGAEGDGVTVQERPAEPSEAPPATSPPDDDAAADGGRVPKPLRPWPYFPPPPPYAHYLYQRLPPPYTSAHHLPPPTLSSFRKYYLKTMSSASSPPGIPDLLDAQAAAASSPHSLTSFEIYDVLRRERKRRRRSPSPIMAMHRKSFEVNGN